MINAHRTIRRPIAIAIALVVAASACNRPSDEIDGCTGTTVDLVRRGSLLAGTAVDHRPFAFPRDGEPVGLEIDIARALGAKLNLDVVIATRASSALVPGLLARRFDIAGAGLRGVPALADAVCTTAPYLRADLAVVVRADAPADAGTSDGTVAVEQRTPGETWARDNVDGARLRRLETTDDVISALRSGQATSAVLDHAVIAGRDRTGLRIARRIAGGAGYVFALHPSNAGLRDAIDAALGALRADGTLDTILERWVGEAPASPAP